MRKILLSFCFLSFAISNAQEIDFSTPNVNTYGTDPMQGISGKSEFNEVVKKQAEKSYDHGTASLQKAMEKADAVELKSFKEIQNETQGAEFETVQITNEMQCRAITNLPLILPQQVKNITPH